jgi:hypothetical protein
MIEGTVKFAQGGTVGAGPFYLLGLMSGHWDVPGSTVDSRLRPMPEEVNTGIGVVVPVAKIQEVLDQPTLANVRDEWIRENRAMTDD